MRTSTLLALALGAAVAGTASAQTCGDMTVDCAAEDVNTEEMPADTPCRNCDAAECCAPPTSVGSGPPEGCTSWHDGCNTCQVMDGGATACTRMACATTTPPYCMAYADGRECTNATTCNPAVDPVDPAVDEEQPVAECSEDADCARGLVCQGQWNNALAIYDNFACVEGGTVGIMTSHDDEHSDEDGVAEDCVGVACEPTAGEGGVDCAGVGADTPCDFTALVAASGRHLASGAREGLVAQYCACQRVLGEHTELVEAGVTASCDGAADGQPEGAATGGEPPLIGGR